MKDKSTSNLSGTQAICAGFLKSTVAEGGKYLQP